MQKLNGREIYVVTLLVIITVVLSIAFVLGLVSDYSTLPESARETIRVKDLVDHIHTLLLVIMGAVGSIMMIRKKLSGWILAFTLLTLFTFIMAVLMVNTLANNLGDLTTVGIVVMVISFLAAVSFLFFPATLQKYRVGKNAVLPTLVLFMALAAFYIYLQ